MVTVNSFSLPVSVVSVIITLALADIGHLLVLHIVAQLRQAAPNNFLLKRPNELIVEASIMYTESWITHACMPACHCH